MVETPDKITPPRSARDSRVQRRIQDQLRLLKRRQLTKVAQELEEAQIARQVGFAEAPKHPQIGLEEGEQALCPVLMHVTACIFLLRMVDKVVRIALECAIAAGRVCIEPTARFDGKVGRFLHRLHGKVPRALYDNSPLTADPGDDGRPVFVVVPPTGLALLAATPWPTPQRLLPALLGLAFLPGSVIERSSASTVPSTWRSIS